MLRMLQVTIVNDVRSNLRFYGNVWCSCIDDKLLSNYNVDRLVNKLEKKIFVNGQISCALKTETY